MAEIPVRDSGRNDFLSFVEKYNVPFTHLVSWGAIEGAEPLSHGATIRSLAAASGFRKFDASQIVDEGFVGSAQTFYGYSTSASDTGTLLVHGVDANGDYAEQTVTLTGTTPVAIAGTWLHIQKLIYTAAADNVGSIYVSTEAVGLPAAGDFIQGIIEPAFNYAVNPYILVPNGWHYAVMNLTITTETKTVHVRLERDTKGKNLRAFEVDITEGHIEIPFPVPMFLKQGDKLRVLAESITGTVVGASFGLNGYILRSDTANGRSIWAHVKGGVYGE